MHCMLFENSEEEGSVILPTLIPDTFFLDNSVLPPLQVALLRSPIPAPHVAVSDLIALPLARGT